LESRKLITWPEVFTSLASVIRKTSKGVFEVVVVDEAQDIAPFHLRLFAESAQWIVLCQRFGTAHLSTTVLVEVARC
jgi:hypothetical protein